MRPRSSSALVVRTVRPEAPVRVVFGLVGVTPDLVDAGHREQAAVGAVDEERLLERLAGLGLLRAYLIEVAVGRIRQRQAKARLYAGFSATVSMRALIIRLPIEGSLAHDGTRPHRSGCRSGTLRRRVVSPGGEQLQHGVHRR